MKLPNQVPLLDSKGYTAEQMREYATKMAKREREEAQREFWDACKAYGKTGECVYLTYKGVANGNKG